MGKLRITETTKDRMLNGALLISLALLLSGVVRPSRRQPAVQPDHAAGSVFTLRPLSVGKLPTYEEAQPMNVDTSAVISNGTSVSSPFQTIYPVSSRSSASKASSASNSVAASSAVVSAPAAAVQPVTQLVQNLPAAVGVVVSPVAKTVNQVVDTTANLSKNLKLF